MNEIIIDILTSLDVLLCDEPDLQKYLNKTVTHKFLTGEYSVSDVTDQIDVIASKKYSRACAKLNA